MKERQRVPFYETPCSFLQHETQNNNPNLKLHELAIMSVHVTVIRGIGYTGFQLST